MEKNIKTITITRFDFIINSDLEEQIDETGKPDQYSEFDRDGRPLKEIHYNRSGEFEEMFEFVYNDHGFLIGERYYPVEDELAETKEYTVDESGLPRSSRKIYLDGSIDTTEYEYNERNELLRKVTRNDDGEIDETETFTWEDGKVAAHHVTDGDGTDITGPVESAVRSRETRIERNEKGQILTEEELDEDGNVFMTVNRFYTDDGKPDEVEVSIDGQGRTLNRHYFLKYGYTFHKE